MRYLVLILALLAFPCWALPPRVELLPGATAADWLLIIEADGERDSRELEIAPLLRQFAVGRVTMSRVTTPVQQLTRWQIPLHLGQGHDGTADLIIPSLKLGDEMTQPLHFRPQQVAKIAPPPAPAPAPMEMQARLLHQGPLYPGQPVIYQLTLWLPANLQHPGLSELTSPHFIIRRLGDDEWIAPAQGGLPGRLTRSWLIQAREPGHWQLESPRLQGQLPRPGDGPDRLSARAAPLQVRVDKAPATPVASALTLRQRIEPASEGLLGEPLIRILTLTLENGDSSQVQLAPLMASRHPDGLQAHPDGERQDERYRDNALHIEREWRQTLSAQEAGTYLLPPIELSWFNTQTGKIERLSLPATRLSFQPTTGHEAEQSASREVAADSLWWVLLALGLRMVWRRWPRWRAFYYLQRALCLHRPDASRKALIHWASLRWQGTYYELGQLQRARHNHVGAHLEDLERVCFSSQPTDPLPRWQQLADTLRPHETIGIAHLICLLAHLSARSRASAP